MAENRSLRVSISADVADYVSGMEKAARATRNIATAAAEVRGKVDGLGSGTSAGLTKLSERLDKVATSLNRIGSARDLNQLANGVKMLSGAGSGLTQAVTDINKLAKALATVTPASAKNMKDVATALHQLGQGTRLNDIARDLGKMTVSLTGLSGVRDLALLANGVRSLSGAGAGLTAAVNDIKRFASAIRSIDAASATGMRDIAAALHDLGMLHIAGAAEEVTKMSAGIRRLIKDANSVPALRALTQALKDLAEAGAGLGNLGNTQHALAGMQAQIDALNRSLAALRRTGTAGGGGRGGLFGQIFGGAALANLASNAAQRFVSGLGAAIKSTVTQTADFETEINTLGAVLKATPDQLKQVSAKALQLGADFTIANTNASDAAVTMTELGKGGLSLADSMSAAKGTLQLATAGQVDFARAADIMTSQLAAFGLQADQAARVTDLLANTANASRGNIADFAEGFKYAGTVSHQAGYSIEETAAVLSVFAKAGLTGSVGGTVMKEMLLKLEAPSKKARKAIEELGIEVYDANGEFIKAPELADTLAAAHKRLGNEAFQAAATEVFQARAIQGASIMAAQGGKAIDEAAKKTRDGAGAAAFSAARMQGLGGAFANLRNQVETAQIQLGEKFSPVLSSVIRKVADFVPDLTAKLTGGGVNGIFTTIGKWFDPLMDGASALVSKGLPYVQSFVGSVKRTFESVVGAIKPVSDAIGSFFRSASKDNGGVDRIGKALTTIGKGFEFIGKWVIGPVGHAFGAIITWFGDLGPVATTLGIALGAVAATRLGLGLLAKMNFLGFGTALRGAGVAVRNFRRDLAFLQAGGMGAMSAGLRALGGSFATFGRSIVAAFGGAPGLILAGLTTALTFLPEILHFFSGATKDATITTADFTDAIEENTGALTKNAPAIVSDKVKDAADAYVKAGGKVGDYTLGVLGNVDAQKRIAAQLQATTTQQVGATDEWQRYGSAFAAVGITQGEVAKAMLQGGGAVDSLRQKVADGAGTLQGLGKDSTAVAGGLDRIFNSQLAGATQYKQYTNDVKSLSDQQAAAAAHGRELAAAQEKLNEDWSKVPPYLRNAQDIDKANRITATAFGNLTGQVQIASDDTGGFFEMVRNEAGTATIAITPMQQAFKDYSDAVSAADTTSQLFMLTMDKLAHRDTSVNDAMDANASAAEGLAAAQRQKIQNEIDLRKAQEDLQKAKDNLGKQELVDDKDAQGRTITNRDGTPQQHLATASDATTPDDIAAAQLRLADAQAKVDGTQRDINKSDEEYRKTAALRLTQVRNQTLATKGFAATVKAVTDEMQKQRDAFIKAKVDNGVARPEAEKQADAQGYRTDAQSIVTIISADDSGAQAAFADMKKTVDDYAGHVEKIPKAKRTVFDAEIATAEANGTRLYQVYDKASGTYKTVFETPGAAEAQIRAGGLVRQYDKAKGTWTADLRVKDNGKGEAMAAKMRLDLATKDRLTKLKVVTADALGMLSYYGGNLKRIPPELKTKLTADVKEAAKSGERLYDVYDATTGNWIAKFMTPNDAEAKIKAGAVIKQYDLAKGTWTATLQAVDDKASDKAKNLQKQAQLATQLRTLIMQGQDNASPKVQALLNQISTLQKEAAKPIKLVVGAEGQTVKVNGDGSFTTGAGTKGSKDGGYITGPGGPREDKIPVMLSNGEFVVNAAATRENLPALHALNNRKKYADGGLVGQTMGPVKLDLQETGNINPAVDAINTFIGNARKSAEAINAAATATMASSYTWQPGAVSIVPYSFQGTPFPAGVATGTPPVWNSFLSELVPLIPGGLHPGWNWGYEDRQNVNNPSQKSEHAFGRAIDINAPVNPNSGVKGSAGTGQYQLPPETDAIATKHGLTWGGRWGDSMHVELASGSGGGSAVTAATAASAALGAVGAVTGLLSGSGMERFRPLIDKVLIAHGLSTQYDTLLINQGNQESSGNVNAINRDDRNAREGHPTQGLMQFRDDTFATYADPGFTTFLDPESQFRAFINYVNARYGGIPAFAARQAANGYSAYADGGLVRGPGTGRSDSIPARVSNGEYIVNAKSTAAHLPLLTAINSKNHYANGGLVGSLHALQGGVDSGAGPELASVVAALQAIAQAVLEARDAVAAKREKESSTYQTLLNARTSAKSQLDTAQGRLNAARKAASTSQAAQGAEAAAQLQKRANDADASVSRAQLRVDAARRAPHVGQWGKALDKAEAALKLAQDNAVKAQTALEARIRAVTQSKSASAASRIELAQLQLNKVQTMTKLSVGNAERHYAAAKKAADAQALAAAAAEKYQAAQQRVFQQQQGRAAQMDSLATRLETAKSNVAQLRESRSSMLSSISGNVAGFSGGLVGHQDTRQTFARILRGQQYDIEQTQKFNEDITKLRKLGLSKDALNTLATSGPESAGITASVLAKSSRTQIAQLNATQLRLRRIGDNVGNVVAGDFYDAGIRAGDGLVKGLKSQMSAIQKVMDSVAESVISALTKKLQIHSPSKVMEGHGVNIVEGLNNGIVGSQDKVTASMGRLVQMPTAPTYLGAGGGGGAQRIDVQVFLDGKRIDDRVDVKIDGFAVDLRNSYRKAGDQS